MKKIFILSFLMIYNLAFSQDYFAESLNQILNNNPELKAIQQEGKSVVYESLNALLPNDPELEYKVKENDNYEAGITQKLKFPSYCLLQHKAYNLTKKQQRLVTDVFVVELLAETRINLIRLIYLNHQIEVQSNRVKMAASSNNFLEQKLERGEVNRLAVNRSRLHLLHAENRLAELKEKKESTKQILNRLNGGQELDFSENNYPEISALPGFDDYKVEYFTAHPRIKLVGIKSELSHRKLKLARHQWLPDFKVGIHTDKSRDPKMHFGISIPLWKERNRVKKARANFNSQKYNQRDILTSSETKLKSLFSKYKILKDQYFAYKETLRGDNTLELLKKSLDAGEISAINYFQEVEKNFKYQDKLQELRKDIAILDTQLYNYKLLELWK